MLRRRFFPSILTQATALRPASSAAAAAASHETAQTPAGFKAPPNVGPGRKPGQEANPYKSWEHLSHKWLVLMCFGCLAGGISAGQLAEVDETKLAPKFDRDAVIADVLKHFEFRPDLAATAIRVSFVLAARRAGVAALNIDESCAVVEGLDDIAGVFHFVANRHQLSMEDIASLTAVAAVKFLKGPSTLASQWQWGREDNETPPPRKDSVVEAAKAKGAGEGPKVATTTSSTTKPASSNDASSSLPKLLSVDEILRAVGCTSEAECVALLGGCHAVGEYHEHVSGLENATRVPGAPYVLDNRYFQFLLAQEKQFKAFEVARTEDNKSLKHRVSNMRCVYAAASEKSNKKKTMCALHGRELEAMLRNPAYRKWVEVFAKDKAQWEQHFSSAFLHMIESNTKRLRPLAAKETETKSSGTTSPAQ